VDERKAKRKIRKLKQKIAKLRAQTGPAAPSDSVTSAPDISPLAPKAGFPGLPEIAGVRFAAVSAEVKYQGRNDVMLAEIAPGSAIAGVFTRSGTRAAPVLDCQKKLAALPDKTTDMPAAAIIVNSGNANAFTGGRGVKAVQALTRAVADALKTKEGLVFSASTGVIGEPLPFEKILTRLTELQDGLNPGRIEDAARAIMTTDTFAKGAAVEVEISGQPVKIAGFAKGSGMIAPDMATMLVFVFSDACISRSVLQQLVSSLNSRTFNCITVDSDTSTSDSVIVVATGKSSTEEITDPDSPAAKDFAEGLESVMRDLAHQVVRDGEGATKFIEVSVSGAESDASAHKVAMSIANSPLVKTAFAGEDPNWGRVVMAVGKSGEAVDRDRLSIRFGHIEVAKNGWVATSYREELGVAYMKGQNLQLFVDLGLDAGNATVWTCDLTHQYIAINADYRS
jgi:glutamate N-acetyltransferase / amino-acid N-acetyltransferase